MENSQGKKRTSKIFCLIQIVVSLFVLVGLLYLTAEFNWLINSIVLALWFLLFGYNSSVYLSHLMNDSRWKISFSENELSIRNKKTGELFTFSADKMDKIKIENSLSNIVSSLTTYSFIFKNGNVLYMSEWSVDPKMVDKLKKVNIYWKERKFPLIIINRIKKWSL